MNLKKNQNKYIFTSPNLKPTKFNSTVIDMSLTINTAYPNGAMTPNDHLHDNTFSTPKTGKTSKEFTYDNEAL